MSRNKWLYLTLAMAGLMPGGAHALAADRDQPMTIEADRLDIDDAKGVSVYKGNVRVTKGSMQLSADEVTLYTEDHEQVNKVVAVGAPATYRQLQDKREGEVRAQAAHIEYLAREERILLQDGAHLWQERNEFSGNHIEYDTKAETVKATMAETGKERVQVIIQPRNAGAAR